ncbi:16407_t:CDS:1, partial [Gigaspora rosea]
LHNSAVKCWSHLNVSYEQLNIIRARGQKPNNMIENLAFYMYDYLQYLPLLQNPADNNDK